MSSQAGGPETTPDAGARLVPTHIESPGGELPIIIPYAELPPLTAAIVRQTLADVRS